jgi:hypothetical protein
MCYSGEPLTVQLPGTQTRSFCYVSDMVYMKYYLSFFVFLFAFQCWFMVVIFFISIRLMALFVSWKEKTLVRSTLETQVTLQYKWFLCAVCPDISVVLVWIELIIHYSFRWVYYDWTCWECERGQFWTILVLLECQICIFILVYHI